MKGIIRWVMLLMVIAIGSAALAFGGCGGGGGGGGGGGPVGVNPPADTPGRKVVQMSDSNGFVFVPRDITISRGDTILWFNVGSMDHTTTSGTPGNLDGLWNSGSPQNTWIRPGGSFQRVFDDTTGTFDYFCIPHANLQMFGTVTVNP